MKKTILILSVLSVILTGCSKSTKLYETEMPVMNRSANSKMAVASYRAADFAAYDTAEAAAIPEEAFESEVYERKLIKTGNVSIEVRDFEEADAEVRNFAKSFGGYITNTSQSDYYYSATVKVPAEFFDSAMAQTGNLGKVKNRSENSDDVSDEYYDLESRLESKRILKNKLENYLSKAQNISDLMEIEKQLNQVVSDLEAMEGRMKRLNNQISYSTIYLNLNLPTGYSEQGFEYPDLGEKFKEFGANFVNFLAGLLIGIVYFIVFGIPVIALVALLYWLFFGRIGLLKKLFKFLSSKKAK